MFLTILTRTFGNRQHLLAVNQASLSEQTNKDFQQRMLIDKLGRGVAEANRALREQTIETEYVYILDDDDKFTDEHSVQSLRDLTKDNPPFGVVRVNHDYLGVLPPLDKMGTFLQVGEIGCSGVIVRQDVWNKHRESYGARYEGDYDFIKTLFENYEPVWSEQVIATVQQISRGKGMDIEVRILVSCAGDWGAVCEGETVLLDSNIADDLIRAGYAVSASLTSEKKEESKEKSKRAKKS